jgi:hypothetical protein
MNTIGHLFNADELIKIDKADDLKISPLRDDGVTYGTPTWIWEVVVDGHLYVRAYHGRQSSWYQSAMRMGAGRIYAAGLVKEVTFEAVEGTINESINDAYKRKYGDSPYLSAMIGSWASQATVRIIPKIANHDN